MAAGSRNVGLAGLVPYSLLVGFVVFWPAPVDSGSQGWIAGFLDILHAVGVPEVFGYSELEFTANIAMFVPLGIFLGMVLGRTKLFRALVVLPLTSVFIELIQLLFLDSRVADVRDVIANSIGGWIGIGLIWLWLKASRRALVHDASGNSRQI